MIRYVLPLILLTFIGCNSKQKENYTYFGGKIINPKSKFVVLTNHNNFADTIPLKDDHSFLGKYKDIKEGLYYFKHGPEHQYVYIQPQDSILLRLNTWGVFDESLVFSGSNAQRNNALIEVFLENEEDLKKFYQFKGLNSKDYKKAFDSIISLKKDKLASYIDQNEDESERFLSLLEIALTYQAYTKLEQYAINNATHHKKDSLNNNYFNYKENINTSLDSLMFFYPYNEYVITSLYNDVHQKGIKHNTEAFVIELLNNIGSKIKDEKVKNRLLFNSTIKHFFTETCHRSNKKVLYTFFKLSSDIDNKKEIQRLINDTKHVTKGDKLPSFNLVDATGEMIEASNLVKGKKTVLYFRNHKSTSDEWVASRIKYLQKKNPNINFLIVNSCKKSKNCFTKNIDIKGQLRLADDSKAKEFLTSKFSRLILVDENGIVKNGYSSLSSDKLNQQLADLQK
ncbi:hypothetical protein WH52_01810 [Tenacibaculum holothuriorum]|uniref:Thioredoxin domain-containing protein n=1 Tax=Tenacibaculum holothuriorum TaxID=1635173 RepID=A0A1Y2PHX6_9FLAO|nr:hypothetical protein [Tenacibaculum holothuriorum]OSY89397.1 hypothetical protein WH52_01810 [Tenacibaculum holothuriorum]